MSSVFGDAESEPTADAIARALGPHAEAWEQALAMFAEAGVSVAWRYYRDGGWLAKATRGSKTLAWLAIEGDVDGRYVRITFFFPERLRTHLLDTETLGGELRERIAATQPTGRSLPVTFEVRRSEDLDPVRAILGVKLAVK